jgi:hypothetical protein
MNEPNNYQNSMKQLLAICEPLLVAKLLHSCGDWSPQYDAFSSGTVSPSSTDRFERRLESILREVGFLLCSPLLPLRSISSLVASSALPTSLPMPLAGSDRPTPCFAVTTSKRL